MYQYYKGLIARDGTEWLPQIPQSATMTYMGSINARMEGHRK